MKNGECCLEELPYKKQNKELLIFGEPFYIQLFINYNLFHMETIKVWHADKDFWTQGVNITYVSGISELEDMVIYCGYNQQEKNKYVEFIDYDFFDMQSISANGTFCYEGRTYIVDDVKFVASNPEYMRRAYKDVAAENLSEYLQELAKAPAGRHVDENGQISLWDYTGRYIHQKNGRRITLDSVGHKRKIHIFGDSRVSGYMLEDKDLFSNILQQMLNDKETECDVINYGIPGREIERMEFQLKKADLHADDIVFIMTACHEYRANSYDRQQQFALHMKKIKSVCDSRQVKLCYINLPVTVEMNSPSEDEQRITELYQNYKFNEYTSEKIAHFKEYLFMALSSYGIYYYDMTIAFNRPHEDLLFINMHHYSPAGNKVIADAMYQLIAVLCAADCNDKKVQSLYENAEKNVVRYIRNEYKRYCLLGRTQICLGGGYKVSLYKAGTIQRIYMDTKHFKRIAG